MYDQLKSRPQVNLLCSSHSPNPIQYRPRELVSEWVSEWVWVSDRFVRPQSWLHPKHIWPRGVSVQKSGDYWRMKHPTGPVNGRIWSRHLEDRSPTSVQVNKCTSQQVYKSTSVHRMYIHGSDYDFHWKKNNIYHLLYKIYTALFPE